MKKKIYQTCLALIAGIVCQGQIAAWDFFGQSFPVTCAATTFHSNLVASGGANNITRGPGAPASGGVNSFRTTGFQNNGISTSGTDYFQVTLQAVPGYKLSLSTLDAKFNGTSTFFASPGVTSQFAYSLDGTNFTFIGNPVQSVSLTMTQLDLSGIPDLQNVYAEAMVSIRYYASGQTTTGGWGFYSGAPGINGLAVGGSVMEALVVPPTIQASGITFSNIQQTQIGISWDPGNGEKRMVKINTSNSFTDPVNGTDPPANPVYGGNGEQVVYNYPGSSMAAITGLATGMTYWFRIYECNGSGSLTMFNALEAESNPASQATSALLVPPVIGSAVAMEITAGSAILGGHVTSDGGSPVMERGTVWKTSSPVTISDNKLAEGVADTGLFSHLRSLLPPAMQVFYAAYATNPMGTTLTPESTFFTLANEPPSHCAAFSAGASGTTSIDLAWDPLTTGADGYLILQKQGPSPPSGIPADAHQYIPGEAIGDGIVAAAIATATTGTWSVTGLSPGTGYSFAIFPYAWDGIHPQTTNYFTEPPVPGAYASTGIPAAGTYHWTGASGVDWTIAGNWSPVRNVPALNDILVFDAGGTWTIVNVPSQTIGQISVSSNTSITLQGAGILSIAGDAGEDMMVAQGCQLNISGPGVVTLSIAAGASALVSGSMAFSGGGHRLLSVPASGVVFTAGSMFMTGSGFTGNPFGTLHLNSVVFDSGAVYVCQAGGNPFGAAVPASVVVFNPGSLFRIDAYVVPSFGGRTYGDFEMNYPGTITATGSSAVSIDNFTASQGTFYLNMTGAPGHSIRGNIFVASVATLIIGPSSAGTILMNGPAPQLVSGSGTLMAGPWSTLVISNALGVTLNMHATFNNLTIANGGLLTIAPNAAVTVNGTLLNGSPATGVVVDPDGSLLHSTSGVAGTVKRSFAAANWSDWQDGWHLVSSPVASQSINGEGGFLTTGTGNDYDMFMWFEPETLWVNYKNTTTPPFFSVLNNGNDFGPGRGYLAAYQQTGDKIFTGELNVADIPVGNLTVTGTTAGTRGWHLLGNPYPCSLSWYAGWVTSNIGGVAYVWNEEGMSYTPRNPGDALPPCNGFMVQVTENPGNSGSLIIPASKRIHGTQGWFKEADYPVIKLIARNLDRASFQESQVRFNPVSAGYFEPSLDGRFLPGFAPLFFSWCGGEKLAVNVLPGPTENMNIPFCFQKNAGDHFQIEAQISGGLSSQVLLVDKKTGFKQNLALDPVYPFTSETGDFPDRFELRFSHVGVGELPGQQPGVSVSGNCIIVQHHGETQFEIFGILGKLMVSGNFPGAGSDRVVLDARSGWYLVRLTAGNRIDVSKVFIRSAFN